jgi:hypothetical protein
VANNEGTGFPDSDALMQIQNQRQDADLTEKEVRQSAEGGQGASELQPYEDDSTPFPRPIPSVLRIPPTLFVKTKSFVLKSQPQGQESGASRRVPLRSGIPSSQRDRLLQEGIIR